MLAGLQGNRPHHRSLGQGGAGDRRPHHGESATHAAATRPPAACSLRPAGEACRPDGPLFICLEPPGPQRAVVQPGRARSQLPPASWRAGRKGARAPAAGRPSPPQTAWRPSPGRGLAVPRPPAPPDPAATPAASATSARGAGWQLEPFPAPQSPGRLAKKADTYRHPERARTVETPGTGSVTMAPGDCDVTGPGPPWGPVQRRLRLWTPRGAGRSRWAGLGVQGGARLAGGSAILASVSQIATYTS